MKLFKLFLLASAVILFSSTLYGSDTDCEDNNRTEQGTGAIIEGLCVEPPELPYLDKPTCGDDPRLVQGTTGCMEGTDAPDPGPYPPLMDCPAGKIMDQGTEECTIDAPDTSEPLPINLTIDNAALQKWIVSTYDDTPYDPAIDIQGVIGPNGLTISVPYTVVTAPVTLPTRSTSVTLDASVTQDDETGIIATFAWKGKATLPVGSGVFTATITIDDSAGDGTYYAKKLDINDSEGLVAATFPYATDSASNEGNLTLKIHPGILDRMFRIADNTDDNTTHELIYAPVTNPTTGKTWLNNNLGANYANMNSSVFDPNKQATVFDDRNAFGSFFQWGRKADGHDLINWENNWANQPTAVNGITTSRNDNPLNALFIKRDGGLNDWRINPDNLLWASESSTNNVCPQGYRVPTEEEMNLERLSWESNDAEGALSGSLVLTVTGDRSYYDGNLHSYGTYAHYWTSTVSGGKAQYLFFRRGHPDLDPALGAYIESAARANGYSVRCIKD